MVPRARLLVDQATHAACREGLLPPIERGPRVAFACPAAVILEYSLGDNPLLHDLVEEDLRPTDGTFKAPTAPGLGVTPNAAFIEEYTVRE